MSWSVVFGFDIVISISANMLLSVVFWLGYSVIFKVALVVDRKVCSVV